MMQNPPMPKAGYANAGSESLVRAGGLCGMSDDFNRAVVYINQRISNPLIATIPAIAEATKDVKALPNSHQAALAATF